MSTLGTSTTSLLDVKSMRKLLPDFGDVLSRRMSDKDVPMPKSAHGSEVR